MKYLLIVMLFDWLRPAHHIELRKVFASQWECAMYSESRANDLLERYKGTQVNYKCYPYEVSV